jgi:hypothetical protein
MPHPEDVPIMSFYPVSHSSPGCVWLTPRQTVHITPSQFNKLKELCYTRSSQGEFTDAEIEQALKICPALMLYTHNELVVDWRAE